MATNLNVSDNQERVPLRVGGGGLNRTISPDDGNPYYVGARAYVEQTEDGATITVIDKEGTTTANVSNGSDGEDGVGIVSIEKTSTSGLVDTYTITYTDGATSTFDVTNGQDGADEEEIFVAEYNTTSYSDVCDAYDDGKIIFLAAGYLSLPLFNVGILDDKYIFNFYRFGDSTYVKRYMLSDSGWGSTDTYTFVTTDREINGNALSSDITLTASDVGAQETLVSGTNIKTINNTSLLGSGNIDIQGGGSGSAFVAEYNVTSYADVKDAYDNDAILICTTDDSGNPMVLQFVYFDVANEIFYFAMPVSDGCLWTQLSNAEGWDDGMFYFASTDVATQLADGLMSALDKQKLDGLSKQNIWYGTCSTSASQSPKAITTASGDFSLTAGNMLCVLFNHTNSLSSVSLQVDGGTSKSAYSMDGTSDISNRWGSNEVVMFVYDGTKFVMLEQGVASTTQYGITKLNNTTSSTSTSEAATANAVKAAYDHGGVTSVNGSTGAVSLSIHNVPSGGTSGQVLSKASGTDYDLAWSTPSSGSVTDVEVDGTSVVTGGVASIDLTGKSNVGHTHTKSAITDFPTTVSSFTNDAGYITGYTETDPVFTASAAHGITSSDISAWNGKSAVSISRKTTSGTNIADITINGTTTQLYAPNGGGGTITDVTVDGTSVVTGGVAEIDLTGKSDIGHTHTKSAITDFPTLSTVATTGDYDDLLNKPTLFSGNYNDLTNKPTIPTVNNATLTIQKNGTKVKTFTANASSNVTANITVPTKVSDLTNDSGYITGYTETDPTVPSWAKQASKPSYTAAEVGAVPTTRTVNGKALSGDITLSASDVSALPSSTAIPSSLSDLNNDLDVSDFPNDAGYLTSHQDISGKADKTDTDIDASVTTLFASLGWVAP